MKKLYILGISLFVLTLPALPQTQELDVIASKDNSIFEEDELSNGAGDYIFTGKTKNGNLRRALVQFDLSGEVPEGVSIDSAHLILRPSKVKTSGTTVKVFKVLTEWGEGNSDADGQEGQGIAAAQNDATWTQANTGGSSWIKPGGDFEMEASATTIVNPNTNSVFSSSGISADVSAWIDAPESNFGWIVIGDESTTSTAIRFYSRENLELDFRPTLRLFYQGTTSTDRRFDNDPGILVFSQPRNGPVIVRSEAELGSASVNIFSVTGRLMHASEYTIGSGENILDSEIVDPGVYIYQISVSDKIFSGKFIIR